MLNLLSLKAFVFFNYLELIRREKAANGAIEIKNPRGNTYFAESGEFTLIFHSPL